MTDELKEEKLLGKLEEFRNCKITYSKILYNKEDEQAYQQIVALIKKPGVTEEFIEEKARELCNAVDVNFAIYPQEAKDFIRSLVESVPAKKATVSEDFVGKWADKFDAFIYEHPGLIIDKDWIEQMLEEAGVEVKT